PYNTQAIWVVVCHEKRQSGTAQRLQASQLSLFPPFAVWTQPRTATELLDDHRALEPPDPIPNSEVKRCIADGSVGLPHVRVGHRQAPNRKPRHLAGVFIGRLSGTLCYYCPRCQPGREPGWTAAGCPQGTRPDGACQCRSSSSFKQETPIWKQVGVFFFAVSPCRGKCTPSVNRTSPGLPLLAAPAQGLFIARLPCRSPADFVSLAGVRSAVSLLKELADCPAWLCICRIADIFPFINTPASAIMRSPLLMIESHACSIVEDDVRRTVPLRRGARQCAGCQSRCGMEGAQTARG